MNDFKINIEKKTPITVESFIELGWKNTTDKYPNMIKESFFFEKGNHWISFYPGTSTYPIPFIKIGTIDPSKEEWTPWPEQCKSQLKCPTKESLEVIQNLI